MNYLFQTRGNTVEIFRYEARYTDKVSGEAVSRGYPTKEKAEQVVARRDADGQGTVIELDVSNLEWLDGLEAASFDEALAIYEAGEAAYRAQLAEAAQKSPEQLRADVDYLSAMTGVELV